MKKEEINELIKKVEVVKGALGNSAGYLKPVWMELMLIGIAVFFAYFAEQIVVWTGKFFANWIVWVAFSAAIVGIIIYTSNTFRKNFDKEEAKKGIEFSNMLMYVTFFGILIGLFVQFLPPRVNPFLIDKTWFIWFIAYAFILFSYGIFLSLKHFIISAVIVLLGIPVSMLVPNYEIAVGGIFLGLCLFIPSFIEYRSTGK